MTGSTTWSDAMLRTAVAEQHSWRAVARALGCSPTSAGAVRTIQRRARLLGLDTSHFTGQRRWSDRQLRAAVAESSSWAEVVRRLGASSASDQSARVRGHAARLGLDVSHLGALAREQLPPEMRGTPSGSGRLRDAAVFVAAAWFQLRNLSVSIPVEPEAYDLLVEFPDGPKRVQVKSGTGRHPRSGWMVSVAHRPAFLDRTAGRTCYDPDDIDYFFVIDGQSELYLIPSAELAGRTKIAVSGYRHFRVGSAATLLASCADVGPSATREGE